MKSVLADAFSVGVFAMTARMTARHAQVIEVDAQEKTSEFARMFALRESIEESYLDNRCMLTAAR